MLESVRGLRRRLRNSLRGGRLGGGLGRRLLRLAEQERALKEEQLARVRAALEQLQQRALLVTGAPRAPGLLPVVHGARALNAQAAELLERALHIRVQYTNSRFFATQHSFSVYDRTCNLSRASGYRTTRTITYSEPSDVRLVHCIVEEAQNFKHRVACALDLLGRVTQEQRGGRRGACVACRRVRLLAACYREGCRRLQREHVERRSVLAVGGTTDSRQARERVRVQRHRRHLWARQVECGRRVDELPSGALGCAYDQRTSGVLSQTRRLQLAGYGLGAGVGGAGRPGLRGHIDARLLHLIRWGRVFRVRGIRHIALRRRT